jgi:F-type H+-transporting ATPase subunit epsilon
MPFQCTVLTPERQALDASVTQAIIPAHDGLMGILTGRAPIIAKLGIGPLRVDLAGGQKRFFFISEGVAQVKNDRLTILTTEAIPAEELDYAAASAEYSEAAAKRVTDEKGQRQRQQAMDKARAKREVAQHK